jgi:hypothetical protein
MTEQGEGHVTEEQPRGTLAIMVFFLLVIIGLWIWTYAILLARA